ncbi:hypothetical protein [Paraburkholderia edwinii]|uniref:hypothetical protein n=1 Tax=Paraburkholderia edwinii TaxID=2861782 RepID=UPI001FE2A514|nr:hypothetical protein [Paraburkholderia edwinii]
MKPSTLVPAGCAAAVFVVLISGCASTWPPPPATHQTTSPGAINTNAYMLHAPNAAMPANAVSKPPRLTVGTSYPDTQLILPWFLNDIINFVNYR